METPKQNPVDGSVKFALGGRDVTLALNGRAARLILEHTGVDVYQDARKLFGVDSAKWNQVIWACLQNKANGDTATEWPTLDDVEEYLDPDTLPDAVTALTVLLTPKPARGYVKNELAKARQKMEETLAMIELTAATTSTSAPSAEPSSESPTPSLTT